MCPRTEGRPPSRLLGGQKEPRRYKSERLAVGATVLGKSQPLRGSGDPGTRAKVTQDVNASSKAVQAPHYPKTEMVENPGNSPFKDLRGLD